MNICSVSEYTLEEIAKVAKELTKKTQDAINKIIKINESIHMLSINALIEANKAGEAGRTFTVVAQQMSELNKSITTILEKMKREDKEDMDKLSTIIMKQATTVRGNRLADLALTKIDIIDRSLYERSCDVRWWAKDDSVMEALTNKDSISINKCINRLGVILDAYTVYFDLIVCDLDGNIIANGRPNIYNLKGIKCGDTVWFNEAIKGKEFGFQNVHYSQLVNDLALIFSSPVRADDGRIIGVFATIFKWGEFAQTVVGKVSDRFTRICIIDDNGTILADSSNNILERLEFNEKDKLLNMKKGFIITEFNGKQSCIAHALSPGYETYVSGWHAIVIQNIESM